MYLPCISQVVLVIRCDHAVPSLGISLLGRLVGCVANAHIAAQVRASLRRPSSPPPSAATDILRPPLPPLSTRAPPWPPPPQVMHSARGNVSVVLRGWADDKIEADWSDEEPDEFCISPLH